MSMTPEHTFHDDPEGYICALQNRIDAQAAEIATLKGEVDGWKADAERHCRNEFYYTGLLDEIAKNFGMAAYTSDDGSIQQDPLRAKMPELVATLRTRLDALVTAGEKNEKYRKFFDEMVEVMSDSGCSLDTEEIAGIAESCGLIKWLSYDPNNEVMVDFCANFYHTPDEGDMFWFVVGAEPKLDALAAAVEQVKGEK